jgi:hypothetical protein
VFWHAYGVLVVVLTCLETHSFLLTGLEQTSRWAVDHMEIPSDQAPGISNWSQGGCCGGNCVDKKRWITAPMASRRSDSGRSLKRPFPGLFVTDSLCSVDEPPGGLMLALTSRQGLGENFSRAQTPSFGVLFLFGRVDWKRNGGDAVKFWKRCCENFTPLRSTLWVKSSRASKTVADAQLMRVLFLRRDFLPSTSPFSFIHFRRV